MRLCIHVEARVGHYVCMPLCMHVGLETLSVHAPVYTCRARIRHRVSSCLSLHCLPLLSP